MLIITTLEAAVCTVGDSVGVADGDSVGVADGDSVGVADGDSVGIADGDSVGVADGDSVLADVGVVVVVGAEYNTTGVGNTAGLSQSALPNLVPFSTDTSPETAEGEIKEFTESLRSSWVVAAAFKRVVKSSSSMVNFTDTALVLPKDFAFRIVIPLAVELAQASSPANSSSTTHNANFDSLTEGINPSKWRKLNMAGLWQAASPL